MRPLGGSDFGASGGIAIRAGSNDAAPITNRNPGTSTRRRRRRARIVVKTGDKRGASQGLAVDWRGFRAADRLRPMSVKGRFIEVIGVPVDLGAGRRGVDMGPSAIRVADLEARLEQLGHQVEDCGDLDVMIPETQKVGAGTLRYKEPILAISDLLRQAVETALGRGRLPLVLGGDHSIAIGSIAGSACHYGREGGSLGLIWFDAHGDANTPETTPSGNIHGMSLAISLGLGDPDLVNLGGRAPKIQPRNTALIGLRDVDPGERETLKRIGVEVYTM